MDFERFCRDHSIATGPPGHKHHREGWIQVRCPFCTGNPGWHLGFEIGRDRFSCWRCGSHRPFEVIAALLNIPLGKAGQLWEKYKGRPSRRQPRAPKIRDVKVRFPPGTGPMNSHHRRYLLKRNFDPDYLAELWGLLGTGPLGDYKFRILAPIHHEGQLVSYQCRAIKDPHPLPYKACPKEKEARDHKACLYGMDLVPGDRIVIVEGITDAWRLGPGAVATFGIKYTPAQVALMKRFSHRFILFDPEDPEAKSKSKELARSLSGYFGETEIIEIDDPDPGAMNPEDAADLMRDLIGPRIIGRR